MLLPGGRVKPSKRWSKRFENAVDNNNLQSEISKQKRESSGMVVIVAKLIISSKFVKCCRAYMAKKYCGRKHLTNLKPPAPVNAWENHWGARLLCDICGTAAVNQILYCQTCDNVVHLTCISKASKKKDRAMQRGHSIPDAPPSDVDIIDGVYNCPSCFGSLKADHEYYSKWKRKLNEKAKADRLRQIMVIQEQEDKLEAAEKYRQNGMTLLQSLFRCKMARQVFWMWRRTQRRVMVIQIDELPAALPLNNDNVVVVLTVIDSIKHLQLFRMEKKAERATKEGFLIPGVNAMMNIILTFCVKPSHSEIDTAAHFHDGDAPVTPLLSVNGIKMVMIGQLVLALRDTSNFLALQTYSLTMSSRIAWIPVDIRLDGVTPSIMLNTLKDRDTFLRENINTNVGNNVNSMSSPIPSTVSLSPPKYAATAVDVLPLTSKPSSPLPPIREASRKTKRAPTRGESLSASFAAPAPAPIHDPLGESTICKLRYIPMNPIANVCCSVIGPTMEFIRKAPQKSRFPTSNPSVNVSTKLSRSSKWWMCVSELKLYLYQFFGDAHPRVTTDLRNCTVNFVETLPFSVFLSFSGSKTWQFDFPGRFEARNFSFSVMEAQSALKALADPSYKTPGYGGELTCKNGDGGSIYMKASRFGINKPYGHTSYMA